MKTMFIYFGLLGLVLASPSISLAHEEEDAGDIVEFHIPLGTKLKPWNTPETVVEVRVGQTLRIVNDDTVVHRLHTNDDRPCLHQPESSRPGEFYDCLIINTADPEVDLMYEHNVGSSARFYVRATP